MPYFVGMRIDHLLKYAANIELFCMIIVCTQMFFTIDKLYAYLNFKIVLFIFSNGLGPLELGFGNYYWIYRKSIVV